MSTHTPGPWKFYSGGAGKPSVWMADDAGSICTLSTRRPNKQLGRPGRTQEQAIADARLIAAAPDLLDALRLLLKEMELSGNAGSKDYGWPLVITTARAAIAKAQP